MIRKLIYNAFSLLGSNEATALEHATKSPEESQRQKLLSIVANNRDTEFGIEHGFASIKSVSDFQKAVPVRTYDSLEPYIRRMTDGASGVLTADDPFMFARTSGTAASPKYIPITPGYLKEFRRASVASGYNTLRSYPGIAGGVALSVVSSAREGATPGGVPYGAISGFLFEREPFLIKKFISPIPYSAFLIPDWESRYYAILRLAIQLPVSFIYTLNPSTIVMLARRLGQYKQQLVKDIADGTITPPAKLPAQLLDDILPALSPNKELAKRLQALIDTDRFTPEHIWPELQLVCCWTKAAAAFYLNDFPDFFGSVSVCDITYGASEGRGSVFIAPDKQVLALRSHFFEFINEDDIESTNPTVLQAHELTEGKRYFILFTTSGGLYRYNINDVVQVVGFHNRAPLIEFQYKGGNIASFTGEKISESQVTVAMTRSLEALRLKARFFTVVPEFRPDPHYWLLVEPEAGESADGNGLELGSDVCAELSKAFDQQLGVLNSEYKSKRESLRLAPVATTFIRPGSYERLRRDLATSGVADSQIKLSHLNPKAEIKTFFQNNLVEQN